MLLMTVLIPTFPPKSRHNTNDGAFFRQFWDMGAKDKATGKSRSDVQQRIQQFHSQEFLNSLRAQLNLRVLITAAKTLPRKIQAAG